MRVPLMAALLVSWSASPVQAQWPPKGLQNVQVLAPGTPVSALIDTMKMFTRALGVRCTYCHLGEEGQDLAQYDFASDQKPAKLKARQMLRMVTTINGQYLAALPSRLDPPVTVGCATCHRGIAQPRPIQQVVLGAYHSGGGLDSAVRAYRALRSRYYGGQAYDFGEVPLSDIADAAAQEGKLQDALKFHQLNTELLPNSAFAFRQLGFSFLENSDTASAIDAWQKRLALQPSNPEAKQLLDSLRAKKKP